MKGITTLTPGSLSLLTPNNFFGALKQVNIGPDSQHVFHPQTSMGDDGKEGIDPNSRGVNITKALYSAIVIKDMVSEFIWLLLGGIITYSVAQIYAIDHRCQSGEKDESSAGPKGADSAEIPAGRGGCLWVRHFFLALSRPLTQTRSRPKHGDANAKTNGFSRPCL